MPLAKLPDLKIKTPSLNPRTVSSRLDRSMKLAEKEVEIDQQVMGPFQPQPFTSFDEGGTIQPDFSLMIEYQGNEAARIGWPAVERVHGYSWPARPDTADGWQGTPEQWADFLDRYSSLYSHTPAPRLLPGDAGFDWWSERTGAINAGDRLATGAAFATQGFDEGGTVMGFTPFDGGILPPRFLGQAYAQDEIFNAEPFIPPQQIFRPEQLGDAFAEPDYAPEFEPYDFMGGAGPAAAEYGPPREDTGQLIFDAPPTGTDIPIVSPFLREEVRPRVGEAGRFLAENVGPMFPGVGLIPRDIRGDFGEFVGEATVPASGAELALTAPFFVGGVGSGLRAGESLPRALVRGGLEAFAFDPTTPAAAQRGFTARAMENAGLEAAAVRATGLPYGPVPEPVVAGMAAKKPPRTPSEPPPTGGGGGGEEMVTVYRGIPNTYEPKIRPGDLVTTNKQNALAYGEMMDHVGTGNAQVVEMQVPRSHLSEGQTPFRLSGEARYTPPSSPPTGGTPRTPGRMEQALGTGQAPEGGYRFDPTRRPSAENMPPIGGGAPAIDEAIDSMIGARRGANTQQAIAEAEGAGQRARGLETPRDAAFRRYEGQVETAAKEETLLLRDGNRALQAAGLKPERTPDMEALFKSLHNEGPVPPHLQLIHDDVRRLIDQEEMRSLGFDPTMNLQSDYFPRFWKETKALPPSQGRALGQTPAYLKGRVQATFTDLLNAGYEPKTWNPYEMAAIRRMSGAEYRAQSRLLEILKDAGLSVDNIPGQVPEGWRAPNVKGNVFNPKPYLNQQTNQIAFTPGKVVPSDVAATLEQMFGTPLDWGKVGPVDVHSALRSGFNALKRTKLFGSLFQQMDFATRTGFASMGGAMDDLMAGKPLSAIANTVKIPANVGQLFVANLSPARRAALKQTFISTTPVVQSRPGLTWRLISENGLSGGDVSAFNNTLRTSLAQAVSGAPQQGRPRRIINQVNGAMERGLFDGVYPQAQKMAIENFIAPAIVRSHPDWTDAQIAASVATEANKMFSAMPQSQSALRHSGPFGRLAPHLTEALRLVAFSTNEQESFLKATASTFVGPNRNLWSKYWAGGVVFLTALANTIHFITTGEPLPAERFWAPDEGKYGPIDTEARGPGGFGYNTRFLAPDVPVKGRNNTTNSIDLLGQMDTALRLLDPAAYLRARENVLPSAIHTQIEGKDFFGRPLDTTKRRIGEFASGTLAPIPLQQTSGFWLNRVPKLSQWVAENESRLGETGQLIQASGVNLRTETNAMLRARLAKEAGFDNWEGLNAGQKARILRENPDATAELAQRGEEFALQQGKPTPKVVDDAVKQGLLPESLGPILKGVPQADMTSRERDALDKAAGRPPYQPPETRDVIDQLRDAYYESTQASTVAERNAKKAQFVEQVGTKFGAEVQRDFQDAIAPRNEIGELINLWYETPSRQRDRLLELTLEKYGEDMVRRLIWNTLPKAKE